MPRAVFALRFGGGVCGLVLLVQRLDQFFFIEPQRVRVLPEKTPPEEDATGKPVESTRFHRLQVARTDLGLVRHLIKRQTAAQTFVAKRIPYRCHSTANSQPLCGYYRRFTGRLIDSKIAVAEPPPFVGLGNITEAAGAPD
jgi:hypothetical protein